MKTAVITGITGQDGSYLAEYLLAHDYRVYGFVRRSATVNTGNIQHLLNNKELELRYVDLTDGAAITSNISDIEPDEVYNLGAQSDVRISFDQPVYTMNTIAMGTANMLHACSSGHVNTKFYQASTSEMFGKVQTTPQNEQTPFYPRSPYGVAKLAAHWLTVNYREMGMFACSGILFNHESPRRGVNFVTRKVTKGLKDIVEGRITHIELGNLDAKRDWGHAKDYVRAMHLMLQKPYADDYVLATGKHHSVRDLVEVAASFFGIRIVWEGEGIFEVGKDYNTNRTIVQINPDYYRPTEVDLLLGDPLKANIALDWKPEYNFYQLVEDMCKHEK